MNTINLHLYLVLDAATCGERLLEVADADAEFITARQLGVLLEAEKADEYNKSNGKSKGKPTESAVEKNEEMAAGEPVGDSAEISAATQGE